MALEVAFEEGGGRDQKKRKKKSVGAVIRTLLHANFVVPMAAAAAGHLWRQCRTAAAVGGEYTVSKDEGEGHSHFIEVMIKLYARGECRAGRAFHGAHAPRSKPALVGRGRAHKRQHLFRKHSYSPLEGSQEVLPDSRCR